MNFPKPITSATLDHSTKIVGPAIRFPKKRGMDGVTRHPLRNFEDLILWEYPHHETSSKLVLDDDGKAAYAYLVKGNRVIGDVWLYNVAPTPSDPEWPNVHKTPYANPFPYSSSEAFSSLQYAAEIRLVWRANSTHLEQVDIWLRDQLHAVIRPCSKPGWCRLAVKAGPLAKPLHEIESH